MVVSVKDPGPRQARSVLNHRHDRPAGHILDRVGILEGGHFFRTLPGILHHRLQKNEQNCQLRALREYRERGKIFKNFFSEEGFPDPKANGGGDTAFAARLAPSSCF